VLLIVGDIEGLALGLEGRAVVMLIVGDIEGLGLVHVSMPPVEHPASLDKPVGQSAQTLQ